MEFEVKQVGTLHTKKEKFFIELLPEYIPLLQGFKGFGYMQVLWWFHQCDNEKARSKQTVDRPYVRGPDTLGIYATRSPERPNPIALSCAYVTDIDYDQGRIELAYIDAYDGSPVIDIKPYTPSLDRVEHPITPGWCEHWPISIEESAFYDWEREFTWDK